MRLRLFLTILFMVMLCGCGGGNGGTGGLVIKPSSVTLSPGESQTFTVSTVSPVGTIDGIRLHWASDGGTFWFNDGLAVTFTAGDEPGDYTITASDDHLFGSTSITIR